MHVRAIRSNPSGLSRILLFTERLSDAQLRSCSNTQCSTYLSEGLQSRAQLVQLLTGDLSSLHDTVGRDSRSANCQTHLLIGLIAQTGTDGFFILPELLRRLFKSSHQVRVCFRRDQLLRLLLLDGLGLSSLSSAGSPAPYMLDAGLGLDRCSLFRCWAVLHLLELLDDLRRMIHSGAYGSAWRRGGVLIGRRWGRR